MLAHLRSVSILTLREVHHGMAKLIETAVKGSKIAVVEAPVGTGKSYAYLLPAILSGKRTVIATAKKQLQHQIQMQQQ